MILPLEDTAADIAGKAQRGLGISDAALAERAGLSARDIGALHDGRADDRILRAVAPVLDLHAGSLLAIARGTWRPEPVSLEGLRMFTTDCRGMLVNHYVVYDPASREAAVFDTGADAAPVTECVRQLGLQVRFIGITHSHFDHIFALSAVRAAFPDAKVFAGRGELPSGEATEIDDGGSPGTIGALAVEARETSGHARCGITWVIRGLARPVAIVGDALFAGSMGGGMVSWKMALDHNRRRILTLPPETILCPGHGPLTTVAWERDHNPCYPEFKPSSQSE